MRFAPARPPIAFFPMVATMDHRIPASVQPLLQDYLQQLQEEVPNLILGVYLHGSITYEAFCEQASDIDVLAVTARTCSTEELASLARIHAKLRKTWPGLKLEVSYVPQADCSRRQPGSFPPHPYHHEGKFVDSGIFDFNSPLWAANLWWMVKTRGIALFGPKPDSLGIQVTESDIVATSRYLVEKYWPRWTRPWRNLFKLHRVIHAEWVVCGTLRAFFTLREKDITSKPDAAAYGIAHLPKRWHTLIRETMENRRCPTEPGLVTRVGNGIVTARYLRFILRECRQISKESTVAGDYSKT